MVHGRELREHPSTIIHEPSTHPPGVLRSTETACHFPPYRVPTAILLRRVSKSFLGSNEYEISPMTTLGIYFTERFATSPAQPSRHRCMYPFPLGERPSGHPAEYTRLHRKHPLQPQVGRDPYHSHYRYKGK